MRNLREFPITSDEVIEFMKTNVGVENAVAEAMGLGVGAMDPLFAEVALEVLKAAKTIVDGRNSANAKEVLQQAFNCRNIPAETEEEMEEVI